MVNMIESMMECNNFSCVVDFTPETGKLFVGGLSWVTTAGSFTHYFRKFGSISDCKLMYNPRTQKPRGFGFVTFAEEQASELVLRMEHHIDNKNVEVKRCTPKVVNRIMRQREDLCNARKIFLGGIPPCANEGNLHKAFEQAFGPVEEVVVMVLPDQVETRKRPQSRGFGFVTFESENSAICAVRQKYLHVLGKQVEIKAAEPKNPCDMFYRTKYPAGGHAMIPYNAYQPETQTAGVSSATPQLMYQLTQQCQDSSASTLYQQINAAPFVPHTYYNIIPDNMHPGPAEVVQQIPQLGGPWCYYTDSRSISPTPPPTQCVSPTPQSMFPESQSINMPIIKLEAPMFQTNPTLSMEHSPRSMQISPSPQRISPIPQAIPPQAQVYWSLGRSHIHTPYQELSHYGENPPIYHPFDSFLSVPGWQGNVLV